MQLKWVAYGRGEFWQGLQQPFSSLPAWSPPLQMPAKFPVKTLILLQSKNSFSPQIFEWLYKNVKPIAASVSLLFFLTGRMQCPRKMIVPETLSVCML